MSRQEKARGNIAQKYRECWSRLQVPDFNHPTPWIPNTYPKEAPFLSSGAPADFSLKPELQPSLFIPWLQNFRENNGANSQSSSSRSHSQALQAPPVPPTPAPVPPTPAPVPSTSGARSPLPEYVLGEHLKKFQYTEYRSVAHPSIPGSLVPDSPEYLSAAPPKNSLKVLFVIGLHHLTKIGNKHMPTDTYMTARLISEKDFKQLCDTVPQVAMEIKDKDRKALNLEKPADGYMYAKYHDWVSIYISFHLPLTSLH